MDNKEAWTLYQSYLNAWNSTSLDERKNIADRVLADDIAYLTARHDRSVGRSLVLQDMATFHERFSGGHFEIGDVSAHHDVAVLSWVIIQADGVEYARGIDQIRAGEDGRISQITTFAPSQKVLS